MVVVISVVTVWVNVDVLIPNSGIAKRLETVGNRSSLLGIPCKLDIGGLLLSGNRFVGTLGSIVDAALWLHVVSARGETASDGTTVNIGGTADTGGTVPGGVELYAQLTVPLY